MPYPLCIFEAGEYLIFNEAPRAIFTKVQSLRISKATERFLTHLNSNEPSVLELDRLTTSAVRTEEAPVLHIHCAKLSSDWPTLGDNEAYQIKINTKGVELQAKTEWGVCAGMETLAQLSQPLPSGGWLAQTLRIEDQPAYPWRGLCLDVCRHWLDTDTIMRVLDGMAASHLNVLHLHLSDDQAFRLDLRGFPGSNYSFDGNRYSEEDIKAIINHAADRAIRVVPEIDIPGHSTALLAGHPTLGMNAYQASTEFGAHEASLDPAQEYTYIMLQELFTKLATLFPDRYVHTGGDEVNTESWRQSDNVQRFMKQMGIKNFRDLTSHFNRRVYKLLKSINKSMVVWEEALHPRLPKDVLVQSWRSAASRDHALVQNHKVIFSSGYYLDLFLTAKTHYRFDPGAQLKDLRAAEAAWLASEDMQGLRPAVTAQLEKAGMLEDGHTKAGNPTRVLGGEGCLWTELVDKNSLDYHLFSRLPAIAERLWLGNAVDDYCERSLYTRLATHHRHLENNTELAPLSAIRKRLSQALLSPETVNACVALLRWLEPLKWYRRLLGDDAIKAMILGTSISGKRPYDVNTPLNRMVDMCPPESLAKYELEQQVNKLALGLSDGSSTLSAEQALAQFAAEWQQPLKELKKSTAPLVIEALHLAKRLHDCGDLLLWWTDAAVSGTMLPRHYRHYEEELRFLASPVGELSLAVITQLEALLNLCETKESLTSTRPKVANPN